MKSKKVGSMLKICPKSNFFKKKKYYPIQEPTEDPGADS
jgi:hypothetical protein